MALKISSTIICLVLLFYSCKRDSSKEMILSYDYYKNNQPLKIDSIVIKKQQILSSDTFNVYVYFGNTLANNYKEYTDSIKGIFGSCVNTFELIYSFMDSGAREMNCLKNNLFESSIIEKKQSKSYKIAGNFYEIKSFAEYSPPYGTIVSYYNTQVGFLCFYIAENNSYFLLNNSTDVDTKDIILKDLEKSLIQDTVYFGEFVSRQRPAIPPPMK